MNSALDRAIIHVLDCVMWPVEWAIKIGLACLVVVLLPIWGPFYLVGLAGKWLTNDLEA